MFSGVRIRSQLLFSYSLLYAVSLLISFATFYFVIQNSIKTGIESELLNTTTGIYNLVRTAAAVSIKNYLRSVAEKNLEIIDAIYQQQRQGLVGEAEARQRAASILLSQTIGDSGYIYCLDSRGIVVVHPATKLIRTDVSEYAFVKDLIDRKKGYLEYDWQNPDETTVRPKALYSIYFAPWDWLICVSSYRSEFKGLVNVDDFKQSVFDQKFGTSGYAFVIDGSGTAIIHPTHEGVDILAQEGLPRHYMAQVHEAKINKLDYPWQNPGEKRSRLKFCIFNYIEEYDWYVFAAIYHDELYAPLKTLKMIGLVTFGVSMLLVLVMTLVISESITAPLRKLMSHFHDAPKGDFSKRMVVNRKDEIGQLAGYYNRFMQQLEEYSRDLESQIWFRRQTEERLRISETRYRSVMEAAADPIVIYDMEGLVTYFNPAFQRVFGWSLKECLGRTLDHFVPADNWPETRIMIETIKDGKSLAATETQRVTRDGDIRTVSVSGAAFRGHDGQLAGSVVILRDITETKRYAKQLLDIGDTTRQAIGQNLHDDLCPHLIGTGGLVSALKKTIENSNGQGVRLAEQIIELIHEATEKARGLAGGLCPVHLVSFGLQSALNEIAEKTTVTAGLTCRFSGDPTIVFPDNNLATHLYYIVQEAVNNSVRHASATAIDISLYRKGDYIHLIITDDGVGIGDNRQSGGIGLQIMQHRALTVGAFLSVSKAAENGTVVHLFLKVPRNASDDEGTFADSPLSSMAKTESRSHDDDTATLL
ncbi:MAG: cache domain-containing protein [Desulfopila sp.]